MEIFNINYGIKKLPDNAEVISRKACKAVIRKNNEILLIHTNKGDYKFPGGGYKNGESLKECLFREIMEETGYKLVNIGDLLGYVIEQNHDKYEPEKYFTMESEYYSVEIDDSRQDLQNLDDYEKDLNFKPVFIDINKAIQNNQNILKDNNKDQNPWVKRETEVLYNLIK